MERTISLENRQIFGKKYEDFSWDFAKEDTKYSTHGLHPYPAMMIPQVARRLILRHSKPNNHVLDPFCGSGTVLAESRLSGRHSVGVDINPLALLLAKVKTTPVSPIKLKRAAKRLLNFLFSNDSETKIPAFFNINFWFKRNVIKDLSKMKVGIMKVKDEDIRDFFLVCFSLTVRKVSNTRQNEFKLYRIPQDKLEAFNPDAKKIFKDLVERNIGKMQDFYEHASRDVKTEVYLRDMRNRTELPSNKFHLLVTSPPYGDSRTTVAYGQFSRLSMQWIGLSEDSDVDKNSLGGIATNDLEVRAPSGTLKNVIAEIAKQDQKRAGEVLSFYLDLNETLREINRLMRDKGVVCFVIGNRSVKGIRIPTDEILVELFYASGFRHIETIIRNIPNKTMPLQNSPTNIKGKIQDTMHKENIVIVQKEKNLNE
jgi:DNA modification methylase